MPGPLAAGSQQPVASFVFRLTVLGGLSLHRDGARLEGAAAQPKRLALLAALAASGGKGLAREKLMALLWPEADDERARRNLAQAVYSLRQELGDEALQGGTWDLRLNDAIVASDLAEFEDARASGALEQAAARYAGPFLDGFGAAGSSEFDRWAETRRSELAHDYGAVLDRLIAHAESRRDGPATVAWLRKRAAWDPDDEKVATRLQRAVESLPVLAAPVPGPERADEAPLPPVTPIPATLRRARVPGHWLVIAGVAVAAIAAIAIIVSRALHAPPGIETVSIGRLADYRPEPREELIGPLGDLLATSLARSPALRVVSTARMYELLSRNDSVREPPNSAWAEIARLAGATQVVEGALYPLPDGRLMLDLRRVDLKSGEVLGVARAQASEPFALVDSATAVLLSSLGAAVPAGSISSSTTTSLAAYRLYEQGLRAWFRFDIPSAERLFSAALVEDSTFAMAAYFAAKSSIWPVMLSRLRHAHRLAGGATERERLLIRAGTAAIHSDPLTGVYADSLVTRFPEEVEGYYYAGLARNATGDFTGSMPYFERVVAMDSAAQFPAGHDCRACNALQGIYSAWVSIDSIAAGERTARRWIRLLPQSPLGWHVLGQVLSSQGRYEESIAAARVFDSLSPSAPFSRALRGQNLIRQGLADSAAALLLQEAAATTGPERTEALWFRVIALREAGRPEEALREARRYRAEAGALSNSTSAHPAALLVGVALEGTGRFREAAMLYDSVARFEFEDDFPSSTARRTAWSLTHVASALALAGDTTRLSRLADSVRAIGALSGFGRDQILHQHIRGLLHVARGQDSLALDAFRAAIFSITFGYTRTNLEMAKVHIRRGEHRAAIALLEPALRGSLEASNLYAPRTDIHELLARAYGAIGDRSQAEAHRKFIR
jgi:tetratricopeptide (TPR) repeat protein